MELSDLARSIILEELGNPTGSKNERVEYTVTTGLLDPQRDYGRVSVINFKFSTPISEDYLQTSIPGIFKLLESQYDFEEDAQSVAIMFAKILGVKNLKSVGKKRSTGSVMVSLGNPEAPQGDTLAIRAPSGRFVSNSNMSSMLELLAKAYLTKDMQSMGAPLKWRTGRFANSMKIDALTVNSQGKDVEATIYYQYMTRPYAVFNPAVSTYRNLSMRPFAGARNPQKLIGEALAKAARDLIHSSYKIVTKEGVI